MPTKTTLNPAAAVLWASAFLIAALLIVQAGKMPGNPAFAETAAESAGVALLTVDSGRGDDSDPEEVLCVIDSRDEVLLVYEIEDARKRQIILRSGGSLRNLFQNARR